ncbi:SCO2584 family spore wall biosynthesis protein [Streptomyces sp. NPDC002004]
MPEDVGGTPFPDGWEPDDDHDRGVSDEEFASVVFDEDFVRAAEFHEPTAVERLVAAAQARAEASEAEARRAHARGARSDDELFDDGYDGFGHDSGFDDDVYDPDDADEGYGRSTAYVGRARWHRTVAWMLALVMGIGMVALAFAAVYRGGSSGGGGQAPPPPASTGVDKSASADPSASAEYSGPAVSAAPRTP